MKPETPQIQATASKQPRMFVKPKPPTRTAAGVAAGFPGMRVSDRDDVAVVAVAAAISHQASNRVPA